MGEKPEGLYAKFIVQRTDGRDAAGSKHSGCDYFVLDLTHDVHARSAALAYAASCEGDRWLLAQDIRKQVDLCNRAALLELEPDA